MNKVIQLTGIIALLVLSACMTQAIAAKDPVYTPRFNNFAIKGYDTVAYFTLGEPTKGSKEFQYEWQGAVWKFSNAEHLEMFKAEPEKYAPQYGGYCAWALAKDKLAPVDPKQWHIVNDKLYLNYNAKIKNKWLADHDNLIIKGDTNWPSVLE